MSEVKYIDPPKPNFEALFYSLYSEVKTLQSLKISQSLSVDTIDVKRFESLLSPKLVMPIGSRIESLGGIDVIKS